MSDRETLAAAILGYTAKGEPERSPDLTTLIAVARERLAQLPEKCGTCHGEHRVPTIDQYTERCPTCHGTGSVYPAEIVERIANAVTGKWVNDGAGLAVAVLDALNRSAKPADRKQEE